MSEVAAAMPRKANECIGKRYWEPPMLFDEFWREGDLALLFGATATGKSILAVQVADALARGRSLDGFRMHAGRRKVLYVDLAMSDTHFQARYAAPAVENGLPAKGPVFRFPESLFRDRPPANEELIEWLRSIVSKNRFQVV